MLVFSAASAFFLNHYIETKATDDSALLSRSLQIANVVIATTGYTFITSSTLLAGAFIISGAYSAYNAWATPEKQV